MEHPVLSHRPMSQHRMVWAVATTFILGGVACSDDTGSGGAGGSAGGGGDATSSTTTSNTSSSTTTTGSSTGGGGSGPGVCETTSPDAPRGGVVDLSADDTTLLVANRDAGSVTVLRADYAGRLPTLTEVTELVTGGEPWQVAVDPCGERGYVVLREQGKLIEVTDLHTSSPTIGRELLVGSEPTSVALSPNNHYVFVANWVEGTVSVVDASTMRLAHTVDLNQTLLDTGYLGNSVSSPRPALAHPRSIAITNDGDSDDSDETVLVTEFFGQRLAPEESPIAANADLNWVGLVYQFGLLSETATTISLDAIDTGFTNAAGATGCFPNQLQSITVRGEQAFVTSICASPRGPLSVDTMTHPAVHAVDLGTMTATGHNLNAELRDYYTENAYADDATRRYPLVANDIAFDATSGDALITANGVDAAYRVVFDTTGGISEVGSGTSAAFIDLASSALDGALQGRAPLGLVMGHTERFAFVVNDITRNVTAIDMAAAQPEIAGVGQNDPRVFPTADIPVDAAGLAYLRGKYAFGTGLDRWSRSGQGWGSCQSCHFEGLSDNVTWYFGRGPRQSTSLDGSFNSADPTDQRIFNWTAVFDEIADFENVARGLDGAVGSLVHTVSAPPVNSDRIDLVAAGANGLNGSATDVSQQTSLLDTWSDVELFAQRVRSPHSPRGLDANLVAQGKALFEGSAAGRCQGCHGGGKWTVSTRFYTPSTAMGAALAAETYDGPAHVANGFPAVLLPATTNNQFMRFTAAPGGDQVQCVVRNVGTFGVSHADINTLELTAAMNPMAPGQGGNPDSLGFNIPSLLGMSVGAPFFHGGNARTLEELLDTTFAAHSRALSPDASFLTTEADRRALAAFILSVDESTTPIAPAASVGAFGGVICAAP